MSWTKRQIIEQAFEEIGLASYIFDMTADQFQSALRRLDLMIYSWYQKNIRIGFPLPNEPNDSHIEQQVDTPGTANEAIVLNLAVRLAPSYGKALAPETKIQAKLLYDQLLVEAAAPIEQQYVKTLPLGAGYKRTERVFVDYPNLDPIVVQENGQALFKDLP
jgi:hypothetical protein